MFTYNCTGNGTIRELGFRTGELSLQAQVDIDRLKALNYSRKCFNFTFFSDLSSNLYFEILILDLKKAKQFK